MPALLLRGIVASSSYQSSADRLAQSKVVFANQQLLASEGRTALILEDIFSRLKNDLFIQNRLADPLLSKDPVVSKIRKIYLDNYFRSIRSSDPYFFTFRPSKSEDVWRVSHCRNCSKSLSKATTRLRYLIYTMYKTQRVDLGK
jgi:hypothetical protein